MHKFRRTHLSAYQEWLLAVADGHGAAGHSVSQYLTQFLANIFEIERRKAERRLILKKIQTGNNTLVKVIKSTFADLQEKLER